MSHKTYQKIAWLVLASTIVTVVLCAVSGYVNFTEQDYSTAVVMSVLGVINAVIAASNISLLLPKKNPK